MSGEGDAPAFDQRCLLTARYAAGAGTYAQLWAPVIGRITRRLLPALPLIDARRVVDIGTGTGHLLPHLQQAAPDATIVGVDLTFGMARHAATHEDALVAVMDARRLALRPGSVDTAIAAFMLFHLPQPQEALDEVERILRPGGWIGSTTWAVRRLPRVQERASELLDREGAPTEQPSGEDSYQQLDSPDKLRTLLSRRFVDVRSWVEPLGHRWEPEQMIALLTGRGSFARRMMHLDPDRRGTVASQLQALVAAAPARDLVDSSEVVLTVARRPRT